MLALEGICNLEIVVRKRHGRCESFKGRGELRELLHARFNSDRQSRGVISFRARVVHARRARNFIFAYTVTASVVTHVRWASSRYYATHT
jgi:hypothetical protein